MSPPPIGWSFGLCALALLPAAMAQAEPVRLVALDPLQSEIGSLPSESDLDCLALNIYWEARSEPRVGQIAVAAVTLNRVADPAFPDTVCAVVRQGEERGRDHCQFSWHCDGLDDRPTHLSAWLSARQLARLALAGQLPDPTGGALWFHSDQVHPDWAGDMALVGQIGTHLFYRPPAALSRRNPTIDHPHAAPVVPASTTAANARMMFAVEPAAPPPEAPGTDPEAPVADPPEPCSADRAAATPDLMRTLAAANQEDFLALVDELRRRSGDHQAAGRLPCADAAARDGRAQAFAPASDPGRTPFGAGYRPFPLEATLPGAILMVDAGAPSAEPRLLSGSFGVSIAEPRLLSRSFGAWVAEPPGLSASFGAASGRGGALTHRDLAPARITTAATQRPATASATVPLTPPAHRTVLASDAPGPEHLALADSIGLFAEPAIQRPPALAPAQLLTGFEPPAPALPVPASPF